MLDLPQIIILSMAYIESHGGPVTLRHAPSRYRLESVL